MSEPKIEWTHPAKNQWNLIVDGRVRAYMYDFTRFEGCWRIEYYCKPRSRAGSEILPGAEFLTVQLRALELAGVK